MKTVALVDFLTAGHHYAFIRLFAKYLIYNDYRVCLIYPEKCVEVKQYLMEQGISSESIICYEAALVKKKINGFGRFNDAISTFLYWLRIQKVLNEASRVHKVQFHAVFFAWLDDLLVNYLPHSAVDLVFRHKWSGLYFHPWYLNTTNSNRVSFSSRDSVLRSMNCLSVAVHDEFLIDKLKGRIQKNVLLFPEMADATAPENEYFLSNEIKTRAGGRRVIGLIGCEKRKGVLAFFELIKNANASKYFFFLAGPIPPSGFSESERLSFADFVGNERENFFYYRNYIPEGAKINGVISSIDIIFLVYENFLSSSNFCTKAVLFKKLVLATENYWIGAVTRKYRLGEIVPEGNSKAMVIALDKLNSQIADGTKRPDWDSYLEVHREENLKQMFALAFEGFPS